MKKNLYLFLVGIIALFGMAFVSFAASSYDEIVDGDLGDEGTSPTPLSLSAGDNTFAISTGDGDRDYAALTIPAGHELSSITLDSYSGDGVSFIGVVSGTQMTIDPTSANQADLLGYHLFGSDDFNADILPSIGAGSGSMGFTGTLAAGTYTFWIQDTGGVVDLDLNFVVTTVSEPPASSGHSEAEDGDLSDDRMTPTEVTVELGDNVVSGSTGAGDRDYLTLEVPAGHQLTNVTLDAYNGVSVSFIAVVTGTQMAVDPDDADPALLQGYYLFGSSDIGSDLLAPMGDASDAVGFAGPLGPGAYTFWIQETGGGVSYEMTFEISSFATAHNETDDGDMSGDEAAPTSASLVIGGNTISGNMGPGDLDFVTFTVPAGHQLSQMNLQAYSGVSIRSLAAIVNGTELGVEPDSAQQSDLLGYYLIDSASVGTDILPAMGEGFGAQGFTPPLPAGDYTMWFQENATPNVDYAVELIIEEAMVTPPTLDQFIYLPIVVRD